MLANYHTHTIRCQHAKGEDRAYVEEAIRNGMKVLGFADHCPWVYDDGFVSGTRMTPSQLDEYFTSLDALKKEIFEKLAVAYVPDGVTYDQVTYEAKYWQTYYKSSWCMVVFCYINMYAIAVSISSNVYSCWF